MAFLDSTATGSLLGTGNGYLVRASDAPEAGVGLEGLAAAAAQTGLTSAAAGQLWDAAARDAAEASGDGGGGGGG